MTETIHPSACPLDCPDLCTLEVAVEDGRIARIGATSKNPLTDGFLCSKVRGYADHVYHETRVMTPLVRTGPKGSGEFREASWDEAMDLVTARLTEARDTHGGDSILPLVYGGSNGLFSDHAIDDLFFARLGACRLERTICAVPTGIAARALYGKMRGVDFADYVHAKLIVVWGTNPHATGIHLVPHIKRAREAGAKLVVIDPRRTPMARTADLHLAVRPGTDLCLALAVARHLFESGAADEEFLAKHCTGVELFRERAQPWTLARAAEEAGLELADVERFATWYAESNPAVVRCGWGLERNRNGGSAASAVLALPAIGGKFGVRGGGYTMSSGAVFDLQPAVRGVEGWGRVINQTQAGQALVDGDPPVRVAVVYNHNPMMTLPRQDLVRRGFEREDLFTVVMDQVMTDTARYADVVLPSTTFLEHDELRRGYGASAMTYARPVIAPVGESRPNADVFRDLAKRMGVWRKGDPETTEEMLANAVGKKGAVPRQLEETGIALPEVEHPIQMVDAKPWTDDGKVHLAPDELEREAPEGLYVYRADPKSERHPLALISPALGRQVTSSLGELHTEIVPLQMHPDDAAARGLETGAEIRAFNELGSLKTTLEVTDEVPRGTASLPKGLWSHHTLDGATANALAPDTFTDLGQAACYNDARIEVERA